MLLKVLLHYKWVIIFTLLCGILYEQALARRDNNYQQLSHQLASLQEQKREALKRQEDLQRQINSQSDIAWIELVLMKDLGLCPEGYQKIYFEE